MEWERGGGTGVHGETTWKTKAIVRAASHDLCSGCGHCAMRVSIGEKYGDFDLIGNVHYEIFQLVKKMHDLFYKGIY